MSERKDYPPLSHIHRARNDLLHTRTTGSIRNSFRNKFINRLRTNRSRSVDRFRQIVEDYGTLISYRSISDLRRVLGSDPEAVNLMQEAELNQLFNEISQELAQVGIQDEGDQHLIENHIETEDILNRHLVTCKLCQTPNSEGDVCAKCNVQLENEFRLN